MCFHLKFMLLQPFPFRAEVGKLCGPNQVYFCMAHGVRVDFIFSKIVEGK